MFVELVRMEVYDRSAGNGVAAPSNWKIPVICRNLPCSPLAFPASCRSGNTSPVTVCDTSGFCSVGIVRPKLKKNASRSKRENIFVQRMRSKAVCQQLSSMNDRE